jgi:very-short-patch-repair endonuclease/endogenous inhibitor of DNA gyrase (YacG/DUF329 family)
MKKRNIKTGRFIDSKIEVKCDCCKKLFKRVEYRIKRNLKYNFCSMKCVIKFFKGKNAPNFKIGKQLVNCTKCGKEFLVKPYKVNSGKKLFCSKKCFALYIIGKPNLITGQKLKILWKDKEYRNKQILASRKVTAISPNNVEKTLIKLFKKLFPGYKFVGNRKIIINGFIPDFLDKKQKKIIELFGDYWHRNTQIRDKLRLESYKKEGYKTLVIWEHELKDLNRLISKINNF